MQPLSRQTHCTRATVLGPTQCSSRVPKYKPLYLKNAIAIRGALPGSV